MLRRSLSLTRAVTPRSPITARFASAAPPPPTVARLNDVLTLFSVIWTVRIWSISLWQDSPKPNFPNHSFILFIRL